MSTSVSSVVSHFPKPQNGFTTTTSGSVASGAATVGLASVAGYVNGDVAVFVIDPTDAAKKQTFTGIIDTSGVQVTSVVWTAGTNQTHALGATVVDYATATHIAMITKGLLAAGITQAGGMGAIAPTSVAATGAVTGASFNTTAANGINQAALPLGSVVQVVATDFSAVATGSTVIPYDDTIPQITEGDQFMTQAITPKTTTNRLFIEAKIYATNSVVQEIIGALFQDATANALAATVQYASTGTGEAQLILAHDMAAGTTSATTFRVRVGGATASTTTFNGRSGGRKFGGITLSTIKITEYKA